MAFDWVGLVRALHILGAVVWVGGGLFALTMVLPAVQAAGPAGKGFMMATLRRGGWGKVFGPVGMVTILAGAVLYWKAGYFSDPFGTAGSSFVTVGGLLGLAAFAEGTAVSMPIEIRMKRLVAAIGPGGPTPEQGAQMEALAKKQGKAGLRSVSLITAALLLMVLRQVWV